MKGRYINNNGLPSSGVVVVGRGSLSRVVCKGKFECTEIGDFVVIELLLRVDRGVT